jgi:hypothetical protein
MIRIRCRPPRSLTLYRISARLRFIGRNLTPIGPPPSPPLASLGYAAQSPKYASEKLDNYREYLMADLGEVPKAEGVAGRLILYNVAEGLRAIAIKKPGL